MKGMEEMEVKRNGKEPKKGKQGTQWIGEHERRRERKRVKD
jgi:hypothetical protein